MKVSNIKFTDFFQFKDLEIDLTYPIGHEKAGQPLDKVCIIGQSGTGKTRLLETVGFFSESVFIDTPSFNFAFPNGKVVMRLHHFSISYNYRFGTDNLLLKGAKVYHGSYSNYKIGNEEVNESEAQSEFEQLPKPFPFLIYYPEGFKHFSLTQNPNAHTNFYNFRETGARTIWTQILEGIKQFRSQKLENDQRVINSVKENPTKARELVDELKQWEIENPDPLIGLADECLDKILNRLHLKVNREIDIEVIRKLDHIPIQLADSGTQIPFDQLSTGTQNIILSALPLYQMKPENAIILFDEPENSLYPDIQDIIIDYYTGFAPKSQFFFATHSPIIAASFDPWEIVELKFAEDGSVYQEKYFDGERHKDNYKFYPKNLRWDMILTKIFDLDENGPKGWKELMEDLAFSNQKIKMFKSRGDQQELEKEVANYKKIAGKLNWKIDENL